MYNEKSHGCVCAIQYFHGCSTSPFCHKKFLIYAANYCHHVAKEFIHTVDISRFSDLYIKNLLLDRQTEIWFYLIYGGIKRISNTMYSEMGFHSPHFGFNLPGTGFFLMLLTQHVKKKVWIVAEKIVEEAQELQMEVLAQNPSEQHSSPSYSAPKYISLVCEGSAFESARQCLVPKLPHTIRKQLKWTLTYQQHQNEIKTYRWDSANQSNPWIDGSICKICVQVAIIIRAGSIQTLMGRFLLLFETLYETERVSTEKGEVLRQARKGKARKWASNVVPRKEKSAVFRKARVWRKGEAGRGWHGNYLVCRGKKTVSRKVAHV